MLKTKYRYKITNTSRCSAVGSALGSGPRGHGFESRHFDQYDDSLLSHIKNGDNDSLLFYVSLCFVVFSLRDGIARNNVALRFTTLTPPCGDESRPQPSNVSCERHERSLRVLRPGKSRDFDTKSRLFPMKFMPNGKSEIIGLWNILRMCNILRIWRHKFYFIFAKQKFHNYLIISYCLQYFIECVKQYEVYKMKKTVILIQNCSLF